MKNDDKKYFVLIDHSEFTGNTMSQVLNLEPVTLKEAEQKVAWQIEGDVAPKNLHICTVNDGLFYPIDGRKPEGFIVGRAPFTLEAWEDFWKRVTSGMYDQPKEN